MTTTIETKNPVSVFIQKVARSLPDAGIGLLVALKKDAINLLKETTYATDKTKLRDVIQKLNEEMDILNQSEAQGLKQLLEEHLGIASNLFGRALFASSWTHVQHAFALHSQIKTNPHLLSAVGNLSFGLSFELVGDQLADVAKKVSTKMAELKAAKAEVELKKKADKEAKQKRWEQNKMKRAEENRRRANRK